MTQRLTLADLPPAMQQQAREQSADIARRASKYRNERETVLRRPPLPEDLAALAPMLSTAEMAERYGVAPVTMRGYLRRLGIKRRLPTLEERFWSFVDKSADCWVWTGGRHEHGYGLFGIETPQHHRTARAHRVSWELANQACLLPHSIVMHACDNPPCVRPEHLVLGTQLENCEDRDKKGRRAPLRGVANPRAILTPELIAQAAAASALKEPLTSICRRLSIPYSATWNALHGRSWAAK